jgi:hypothetical protein
MTLSQEMPKCDKCGYVKARFSTISHGEILRYCLSCVQKMRSSESEADHESVSA